MIQDDAQLTQALQQIERLYRALAQTRASVRAENPELFPLLAEGPLAAIDKIQREVDEYSGKTAAIEGQAEVWLKLVGTDISWPYGKVSVVSSVLDAFRRGLFVVAEQMLPASASARLNLQRACDLNVVSILPGSLRVGVKLPEALVNDAEDKAARESLSTLMEVAEWADSQQTIGDLSRKVKNTRVRQVALNAIGALVPRKQSAIEYLELSSQKLPKNSTARLTKNSGVRIHRAWSRTVARDEIVSEGMLRELDLDGPTFTLRSGTTNQMKFTFLEMLTPLIVELLNKKVRVIGTRVVQGDLVRNHAISVDIVDEPADVEGAYKASA